MRIFLSGGWGYGNLGDEAILEATLKQIKLNNPFSDIVVSSYNPKQTLEFHNFPAIKSLHRLAEEKSFIGYRALFKILFALKRNKIQDIAKIFDSYIADLYNTDLFIQAGGGYFNDGWMEAFPLRLLELIFCRCIGIPYVLIGQTLGPFRWKYNAKLLQNLLIDANYISVRDSISYNQLTKMGIKNHVLSADSAFTLDLRKVEKSSNYATLILRRTRVYVDENRDILLLKRGNYTKNIIILIHELLGKGYKVRLSRSVLDSHNDIYKLLLSNETIKAELNKNIFIINPNTFSELLKLLIDSKIVISMNMHPIILASQAGIPVISLSYHYKMDDLMRRMGMAQYNFTLNKGIDLDRLNNLVNFITARPEECIIKNVPNLILQAQKDFEQLLILR